MSESRCSAPHAAMMIMWFTNIDFVQRGETPGTGTMTSTLGTQHRDRGMWARRLYGRDKVFVSLNRRAIITCLLRGSEKWWSWCILWHVTLPSQKQTKSGYWFNNLCSLCGNKPELIRSGSMQFLEKYLKHQMLRESYSRASVLNDFYQQHCPSNISGENHNQNGGKII